MFSVVTLHGYGVTVRTDFEKLYDKMSPAQKKTADTVFNQRLNQRVRTTATPSSGGHS